jgi:hypothetical protein
MLYILQNHYPERLGLALIINVPTLINLFFKAVMPFVDPSKRRPACNKLYADPIAGQLPVLKSSSILRL